MYTPIMIQDYTIDTRISECMTEEDLRNMLRYDTAAVLSHALLNKNEFEYKKVDQRPIKDINGGTFFVDTYERTFKFVENINKADEYKKDLISFLQIFKNNYDDTYLYAEEEDFYRKLLEKYNI